MILDRPAYVRTLGWLGQVVCAGDAAWIERPLPWGDWDARGSWPYQSLPSIDLLEGLSGVRQRHQGSELDSRRLLTWTGVIRPDAVLDAAFEDRLAASATQSNWQWQPLKPHLCHRPDRPAARDGYSRRTRRRLHEAHQRLRVEREVLDQRHHTMARWQAQLQAARGIPQASSPDREHFMQLIALAARDPREIAVITLRHRADNVLCGLLLALHDRGEPSSWHAHSLLCDSDARRAFGAYALFDAAIEHFGAEPIWWGGQPASAEGVWRFKQRFSNTSAPAHLMCLELDPERLQAVRLKRPGYRWLPDYRNPEVEMR